MIYYQYYSSRIIYMEKSETYSTRDINLAAALMTYNFFMTNIDFQIEGSEGKMVGYFAFDKTPELEQVEKDYWQRKLTVEPREFILNLRSLKSQVNSVYKNPRNNVRP